MPIWAIYIMLAFYVLVIVGFFSAILWELSKRSERLGFIHFLVPIFWPVWVVWYIWVSFNDWRRYGNTSIS